MITYTELRRLSLDFRRLSSNFLNSTDDTAATMIQRFKKYIDDTPFISGIISDAIGEVDYDWQNCFRQSKHSGWHEIEVPVDEACHVKAMYDYLDYIISNGSNILGIAMHYTTIKTQSIVLMTAARTAAMMIAQIIAGNSFITTVKKAESPTAP